MINFSSGIYDLGGGLTCNTTTSSSIGWVGWKSATTACDTTTRERLTSASGFTASVLGSYAMPSPVVVDATRERLTSAPEL